MVLRVAETVAVRREALNLRHRISWNREYIYGLLLPVIGHEKNRIRLAGITRSLRLKRFQRLRAVHADEQVVAEVIVENVLFAVVGDGVRILRPGDVGVAGAAVVISQAVQIDTAGDDAGSYDDTDRRYENAAVSFSGLSGFLLVDYGNPPLSSLRAVILPSHNTASHRETPDASGTAADTVS